ncbi:unnamed protein product [Mycena citricolor]|uniref:NmrA-like domain-containing protein n=1 Tax=Mycena citricolor TaxID=2018698 RepID=A0AAD2GZA0_9AGAR|nr:unnamed protein product [Mycena citricolor]
MPKKLVLVTGATGKQGQALIRALSSDPEFHVWALTRAPTSPTVTQLKTASPHVTVVHGNLDTANSIRKIFDDAKASEFGGVWGVFVVLAFPGLGANADGEERQGKTLADLSAEYQVSCFVFSSVERGGEYNDDNAVLDRRAKVMIERHIKQLGNLKSLPWTILRPGFFMENYDGTIGSIAVGVMKKGLKPDTTNQLVAVEDIGRVAAAVFKNPSEYRSKILVVSGEAATISQQLESYKKATRKNLPSVAGFFAKALISLNSDTKGLIADIERVHAARIEGLCPEVAEQTALAKKAYPDMQTFEIWARSRAGVSKSQKANWNQLSVTKLAGM